MHELVLDGLDALATVTLDGTELERTRTTHRTHRFDVTAAHLAATPSLRRRESSGPQLGATARGHPRVTRPPAAP